MPLLKNLIPLMDLYCKKFYSFIIFYISLLKFFVTISFLLSKYIISLILPLVLQSLKNLPSGLYRKSLPISSISCSLKHYRWGQWRLLRTHQTSKLKLIFLVRKSWWWTRLKLLQFTQSEQGLPISYISVHFTRESMF